MMVLIQQFTSINVVLYYASQIFASFGFSGATTTLLATGVTGILEALFAFSAVLYLDIYGGKTFLISGAIRMCICHIVVASIEGVFEDQWKLNEGLAIASGWVAIVFIWLSAELPTLGDQSPGFSLRRSSLPVLDLVVFPLSHLLTGCSTSSQV